MPEQPSILIIENDRTLVVALRDAMAAAGFQVLTAASGEEGLAAAREHRPDLITLDLMLGELTGLDVLRELRRDPEWGKLVPVIILTSVPYLQNMEETKKLAEKIMAKSDFEIPELIDAIRNLLSAPPAMPIGSTPD